MNFQNEELKQLLHTQGIRRNLSAGDILWESGDTLHHLPIVEEGALRVLRQNTEGQEVFLYHLYPMQSCAMALECCQSQTTSEVKIIAETDSSVWLIPVNLLEVLARFPEWQEFTQRTFSERFGELLQVIDLIAFRHMDQQLMHYLQERSKAVHTTTLFITHQQIADEMHTHREAISRLLRTMEQKNLVRLGRNTIELL